ncbi:ornithine carbamoyltransferase [Streptomyces hawaiiensis]|uniref:ornithine carbamoyltransferase n=1 Tax=Streptomyces hawaiiensis TaxID=67305 RepID=UPI0036569EA6
MSRARLFTRASTRTRTAFTAGAIKRGGAPVTFGPDDLQTNTGESPTDTGRVLGSMLDLLVARTAGPLVELRTLSGSCGIPVVNAVATEEHPTQGICDLATISRRGYGLPAQVLEETAERAAGQGAEVAETHSPDELPDRVDFVYTTRWQTTGTSKGAAPWREVFRPFHVDDALMNRWPDAWFLHDLPTAVTRSRPGCWTGSGPWPGSRPG